MEILKTEHLTFTYPCRDKAALKDISLSIEKGEFVTICGKSGCGKSTLVRHLKPILSPHGAKEGTVFFDGQDILSLNQKEQCQKIGYIMQNPDSQIVTDKVWHELAFGLESLGLSNEEIRIKAAETASFFGIEGIFEENTSNLSGGQKQLLNLASVMVMNPSVIILDEPTSQLDPIAAQRFTETLYKINREIGTTVILTEHRLDNVLSISHRLIVMEEGSVIADAPPKEAVRILADNKSDMLSAMPAPMKIYHRVTSVGGCPLTVREGKDWLSKNRERIRNKINTDTDSLSSAETAVCAKNLWFRYTKNSKDVIKDLSLDIKKGEIYAIVGGNGTGKTTALNLICSVFNPQRGKILSDGKVSMLPQNPRNLFTKKTVKEDLWETAKEQKLSKEESESRTDSIISLCNLEGVLNFHPYDLSGGEMQRAGLAKVLLTNPDILLLDEPTKGLDAHFKEEFASMLSSLKESGVTIVLVSHDIEFCAKYADRCGMFFNGSIVSEGTPREFFSGKSFYTTAANRMASDILPEAVTADDIIYALGGEIFHTVQTKAVCSPPKPKMPKEEKKESKYTAKNIFFGILFALVYIVFQTVFNNKFTDFRNYIVTAAGFLLLTLSLANLIPQKSPGQREIQVPTDKRKLLKRTAVAAFMILIAIPFTIYIGKFYFGDRRYYFISMLIILETVFPFLLSFEERKPQAREIIILSVLCALGVAGRTAFSMFPQFKPLLAIVIITGVCFGGESGFLVGAMSGFVSNFFLGQGPWTPWQMFALGIVGFVSGVLFRKGFLRKTKASLCIFGFAATIVIYGGIMNPASVIMYYPTPTWELIAASYLMGLPFDLIHGFATGIFLFFAAEPITEKLDRVKIKYGM